MQGMGQEAHSVKAAADGLVKGVGQVGGAQDEDARVVRVDALHLHQELRLDAPRRLALPVAPRAAQRVNLRTEDNLALTDSASRLGATSPLYGNQAIRQK